ncbi:hypothetical protein [Hymenobacter caeli]|uniref:hypothetical protein n=1 Tax=Hymenobacter caeli TaxID=2735894 RepID=UPI0036D43181
MGIVALGVVGAAAATRPTGFVQEFSTGAVLLASGDTLRGPVRLYRELDMVSLPGNSQTTAAFSAAQVKIFAVKGGQLVDSDPRDFNPAPQEPRSVSNNLSSPLFNQRTVRKASLQAPLDAWTSQTYSGRRGYLPPSQHFLSDTASVRTFRTFLWDHDRVGAQRPTPAFFEQLSNGPYLLLRRQRLAPGPAEAGQGAYYVPPVLADHYYLADPEGHVLRLLKPEKALLAVFRPQAQAITAYAAQHKLDFYDPAHLAELVTYGNSLLAQ